MAHACKLSTWEAEAGDHPQFDVSLGKRSKKKQPIDQDTESHWGRQMEKERTLEKELGTMKEKDKEHLSRADPGVRGTFDPDSCPPPMPACLEGLGF